MLDCGWRTLIIEKPSDITMSDSCVCVESEEKVQVPIQQLRSVVIISPTGTLSIPLMNELSRNNINVFLCDEKRTPSCEIINTGIHSASAGKLMQQTLWKYNRKAFAWQKIVENKILNQIRALRVLDMNVPEVMDEYCRTVLPNDVSNREGQAARVYFSALFGNSFHRHAPDKINAALNYGYTIARTSLDRVITGHGYNTALGINHHSVANRFNLSCDIIEPFRPFIDVVVYANGERDLTWDYKKILIELLQTQCFYKGHEAKLEEAMEMYFVDIADYLSGQVWDVGDIDFDR